MSHFIRNVGIDNEVLLNSIEKLYLCAYTADVQFVFDSNGSSIRRIPAHKNLLAASSDVFTAMFYGELREKGEIKLEGVTAETFEEFLQFFYLGRVKLTQKNVSEILQLGHKYNVVRCFSECVQFFKSHINENNTCWILGVAILYDQGELMKFCEKRIISNTSKCFRSADFLRCEKRVLEHILKMKFLSCSESDVFEACMAWVRAKSKQALLSKKVVMEHLGDLFYEIRFTSMTLQELTCLTVPYDSILSDDFKDIAKMITFPDFQSKKFKRNQRGEIRWNCDAVVRCNRVSNEGHEQRFALNVMNMTEFSTNEPVLLGGFVCAKVTVLDNGQYRNLKSNLLIEVSIIEVEYVEETSSESESSESESELDNKPLLQFKASLQQSHETPIALPKPILMRTSFHYQIRIEFFPENHYFYTRELLPEVNIHPDITIKFEENLPFIDQGVQQ